MIRQIHELEKNQKIHLVISVILIIASALIQSYIMQVFMDPCNLLSGGFTGISILISRITALVGFDFPVSVGIILLNLPAAILCYKQLSKRFVFLSCLQFGLVSLFLEILHFEPFFDDQTLNVLFGGLLWGFSIAMALRAGGSTGGTDFIAQYVSNKIHKGIWDYIFACNCIMLIIFGAIFGWVHAGYSIVFQFLSTKAVSSLYQRYKQITLEIMTKDPEPIIETFMETCHHGMSIFEGYGGYSHSKIFVCKAVVSTYEVQDVIYNVRKTDPNVIINTYHTANFYGRFYQKPLD
ncbi:YitT family protein [Faecalicoccus acidiformans]|uniref:YitT family protein n=1 Tax=Faecalicoccus acidiformans TaxID=915173 RepID=UPI0025A3770A|nr:YitT family protein [Faecalicoccus acidiformans]MDM8203805.1 YitT family protein [Faecalicoccus acidiformans]